MAENRTALVERYYKETDPMKRKKILDKSIEEGEDPQLNQIRREIWEIRYEEPSKAVKGSRCDGFLRLWMTLKYADGNTGGILGGLKRTIKDVRRMLDDLQFARLQEKGEDYAQCLYEECCHLVELYIHSCMSDKSYNSGLMGLISLSEEKVAEKITGDIYGAAVRVPKELKMEKELGLITRAAKEVYSLHFPVDEFEEPGALQRELLK